MCWHVHRKWIALQQEAQRRPVVTASQTVGDFLGYWMREVIEPNRAPLTVATYESLVRLYLVPGIGAKRLDRLSVRDVQTWLNGLRTACQCCAQGKDARRPEGQRRCCAVGKCCRQAPSSRTIRDLRTVLRSALSTAQREELVTKNAAALVTVPSGRARKPQAWTSDEARAFLESARADGDPLYALYVLVLVLGLRKGEALGLAWKEVDLDVGELAVRWQVQRVHRELLRRETKTEASDATLPLPALCVTALRFRAERQARTGTRPVRSGRATGWSSPAGSACRSIRARSTASSPPAAGRPAFGRSPCTMPGGRAPPCWPTSTSTPGSRWRSSGTPTSP